tara:strand:+ start:92 stop:298 length:207 start_codon:yes stop_codon:yes gene_type:complete
MKQEEKLRLSPFYQHLKGKHEGVSLALNIINRRDVNPTSIRWLTREKENIKKQMEILEDITTPVGEEE